MELKMKTILVLSLVMLLSACTVSPEKECPVQPERIIYKKPEFTMPDRPIMRAENPKVSDGEFVRNLELDLFDLTSYAEQLENVLQDIKNAK
jgi:hypothetical protein